MEIKEIYAFYVWQIILWLLLGFAIGHIITKKYIKKQFKKGDKE